MEVLAKAIETAWNGLLGLTEKLVMPDWGALVGLIPVGLAAIVVLFFVLQINRWASVGPRQRGRGPLPPVPPAGVHAPGPSFAPIFSALGLVLLFTGLLLASIGVPWGWAAFLLGIGALVAALLYWLRESMHEYETRVEPPEGAASLPAVAAGPPPGVHMPAPSFRPILVSLSLFVIFAGLIFGPAILVAGIVLAAASLVGWLRDARREYVATEAADQTGHLEAGPAPGFPTRSLGIGTVVVLLAVAVNAGILPPTSAAPEPSAAASGSPGASTTPGGSPAASGAVAESPSPAPAADVTITAQGIQFVDRAVDAPAGKAFTIAFVNKDNGVPHDIAIKDSSGNILFKGAIIQGPKSTVYQVPALPPGTYQFVCTIHPNMTGTITTK